jgi:hypothetical protein
MRCSTWLRGPLSVLCALFLFPSSIRRSISPPSPAGVQSLQSGTTVAVPPGADGSREEQPNRNWNKPLGTENREHGTVRGGHPNAQPAPRLGQSQEGSIVGATERYDAVEPNHAPPWKPRPGLPPSPPFVGVMPAGLYPAGPEGSCPKRLGQPRARHCRPGSQSSWRSLRPSQWAA